MTENNHPDTSFPDPPEMIQINGWHASYVYPLLLIIMAFLASGTSRLATPDLGFSFSKDKIAHFLVFGLIATSILRTPRFSRAGIKGLLLAALLTSLYGACDEWRQSMTPGRSVEFADWLADTAGAIVAVTVYSQWSLYRRFLEFRLAKSNNRANNPVHQKVQTTGNTAPN